MSKHLKEKAAEYLRAGLSVIPTGDSKAPVLNTWDSFQERALTSEELEALFRGEKIRLELEQKRKNRNGEEYIDKGVKMYSTPVGLGIVCGAVSGGLEVIDVDCKYDNTGTLWEDFKSLIEDNLPDLCKSLVVAKTVKNGYHVYYRCSSIDGNKKLANRATTPEDKKQTEETALKKGKTELQAKTEAENDKIRVLLETRGEKGYVIAAPTNGYEFIQGEPTGIPTIKPEERELLLAIAKTFDEVKPEEPKQKIEATSYNSSGLSPFDDYNERGDVIELLQSKGWKVVNQRGERINLLRYGDTDSKTSGNYHTGLKLLRVFSTSVVEFNSDKAYNNSQIFALLECKGDYKEAAKKLLALGYGEAYKKPTQVKTERIRVEVVNSVNRVNSVICKEGETLDIDKIKTALGDAVVITPTGEEAQEEILKVIEFISQTQKRIYIKEGDTEIKAYKYQLKTIFEKYGKIEQESGDLSDLHIDSLLDEIVILSTKLQPLDKDLFLKEFIELEPIQALGISQESLSITVDRLKATKDKEAQAKSFSKLLEKATELQKKGEIKEALELLEDKVKAVKMENKATEFSSLLSTTTEAQIKEEEANLPDSLDSGIVIDSEPLLLPSGQISVIAAPTNHGKTVLLINMALNVLERYPEKKVIFFTYEESSNNILQYFLNTYMDLDLNNSKKSNRRIIKDYFKTGSTLFINSKNLPVFEDSKADFFSKYIETGRLLIKYVDFNSQDLNSAILYLSKEDQDLGGVFIDYFQLLNLPPKHGRNSRQEELKQICLELKDTAVSTGLPVILAAQFNREVTNLMRLHPTNIGEAGDIERIVNTLIGLWNMDKKPVLKGITEAEGDEINARLTRRRVHGEGAGNMYLEILKSRELPTGAYDFLEFNGNTGKLKNRKQEKLKQVDF